MYKIGGTFNGTGADVIVCLGFVPDQVTIFNSDLATYAGAFWNKTFRSADAPEGYYETTMETLKVFGTLGTVIQPYFGGETLTVAQAGTTTYGEGVYFKRDDTDYRRYSIASLGISGDAENEDIIDWTLDTAAAYTGHFNDDVVGTYIGEGSILVVDDLKGNQVTSSIVTLTAATGHLADSVLLAYPVPSGKVRRISGKWDYIPMKAGEATKAGFKCFYNFTDNDTISFWAEKWD
jgi:hypothetical protein